MIISKNKPIFHQFSFMSLRLSPNFLEVFLQAYFSKMVLLMLPGLFFFFRWKQTEIHSHPSVQHPPSPFIYLQKVFPFTETVKAAYSGLKTKVWPLICNWSLIGQFITYILLGKNIPTPPFGFFLYKQIPWYKSTNITTTLVIYAKSFVFCVLWYSYNL